MSQTSTGSKPIAPHRERSRSADRAVADRAASRQHRVELARGSSLMLFAATAVFALGAALLLSLTGGGADVEAGAIYLSLLLILASSGAGAMSQRLSARTAENAAAIAVAGVGLGLLALSSLWLRDNTAFASYFLVIFVFGALALTGVRSQRLLPLALGLLCIDAGLAYWQKGWTLSSHLSLLGDATAALVGAATSLRLQSLYHHDWARTREALEDPLTGLSNRRAFQRAGEQLLAHARREQRPVTLALIDVDQFKKVNDRHGHPAGDAALRSIADSLRRYARRPLDCVVRLGGDEFAVLWYDLDAQEARKRCAALVKAIEAKTLAALGEHARHPSISLGACSGRGATVELADLQRRADKALYQVKHAGGNAAHVVAAAEPKRRSSERVAQARTRSAG